jgi:non-heme chloroperoxidase
MLARSAVLITALPLAGAVALPARGQEHVHPGAARVAHASGHVRMERVRLESGVELEVAFAGPVDGTPVLFLHGITDSWYSFSLVLDRLPPGLRAIAPSQRGHGDSDRPDCCYEIANFAVDAVQLLDALGVERAVVVGHSMGSFVAQHVAVDWPERVERLVLVGSGPTGATPPLLELERLVRSFGDPVAPEFVREFQESTVVAPVPAPFMAGVISETGKLPARVWRDAFRGLVAESARKELARIRVPTLVVWGDGDGLFSRDDQDALLRELPQPRFLVYGRTGHAPHWELPDRFASDLRDFLEASPRPLPGLEGEGSR